MQLQATTHLLSTTSTTAPAASHSEPLTRSPAPWLLLPGGFSDSHLPGAFPFSFDLGPTSPTLKVTAVPPLGALTLSLGLPSGFSSYNFFSSFFSFSFSFFFFFLFLFFFFFLLLLRVSLCSPGWSAVA